MPLKAPASTSKILKKLNLKKGGRRWNVSNIQVRSFDFKASLNNNQNYVTTGLSTVLLIIK